MQALRHESHHSQARKFSCVWRVVTSASAFVVGHHTTAARGVCVRAVKPATGSFLGSESFQLCSRLSIHLPNLSECPIVLLKVRLLPPPPRNICPFPLSLFKDQPFYLLASLKFLLLISKRKKKCRPKGKVWGAGGRALGEKDIIHYF